MAIVLAVLSAPPLLYFLLALQYILNFHVKKLQFLSLIVFKQCLLELLINVFIDRFHETKLYH